MFRPTARQATADPLRWQSREFGPLGNAHSASECGYSSIATMVKALLFLCCPPAVGRLVVAVIVNAINGAIRRRIAHVGIEILKGIPSGTHRNSTCSISPVVLVFRIVTAGTKSLPRTILKGLAHPVSCVVNACTNSYSTAAGSRASSKNICNPNRLNSATVAPAQIAKMFPVSWDFLEGYEPTESNASDVSMSSLFSHSKYPHVAKVHQLQLGVCYTYG